MTNAIDDLEDFEDEEFDDEQDQHVLTETTRSGPGWPFTIFCSVISMTFGVMAGIAGDGSIEVLNEFHGKYGARSRPALIAPAAPDETSPQSATAMQPEWYPENNHIEWSTSLRPNEVPAAIDVRNDSNSDNRRILFQVADGRTYRLAATLYVKAGQQAVIRLPVGAYRIDVASSPTNMPWDKAQREVLIPRNLIVLKNPDDQDAPLNRVFIEEDGKVRLSMKPTTAAPSPRSSKKREKTSNDDYSDLSRRTIEDEPEPENSTSPYEE